MPGLRQDVRAIRERGQGRYENPFGWDEALRMSVSAQRRPAGLNTALRRGSTLAVRGGGGADKRDVFDGDRSPEALRAAQELLRIPCAMVVRRS